MNFQLRYFFCFLGILFFNFKFSVLSAQGDGRIWETGAFAPDFLVKDLSGEQYNLALLKGKKFLLTFYRNAGCPVSRNRFEELENEKNYFASKGIVLLSVYESDAENVKIMLQNKEHLQHVIADPEGLLYYKYNVEANKSKLNKGYLHGSKSKTKNGKKLLPPNLKQDGNEDRMSADFLIDENGNILIAHYSKYLGDHLPIKDIKATLP